MVWKSSQDGLVRPGQTVSGFSSVFRLLRTRFTLGSRGFSCAVSGFGPLVSSALGRRRVGLWPTKLLVAREKKPLVPRVHKIWVPVKT